MDIKKLPEVSNGYDSYKDKLSAKKELTQSESLVSSNSKVEKAQITKSSEDKVTLSRTTASKSELYSANQAKEVTVTSEKAITSKLEAGKSARLEELANQIQNKTFKVNPSAIADKILNEKDMFKTLLG